MTSPWGLTDQQRREAVKAYLAGEEPTVIAQRHNIAPKSLRDLACRRVGPAATVIARMNRLKGAADLRAVLTATERKLRELEA